MQSDLVALRKAADQLVRHRYLKVTPALRQQGFSTESELTRLRRRWQAVKEQYLQEAKDRLNAKLEATLFATFYETFMLLNDWAQKLIANPYVVSLLDAMVRSERRFKARKRLGKTMPPPVELDDPAAIAAMIVEFEKESSKNEDELFAYLDDKDELSQGDKYYVMAMMLYKLAETEWGKANETKP